MDPIKFDLNRWANVSTDLLNPTNDHPIREFVGIHHITVILGMRTWDPSPTQACTRYSHQVNRRKGPTNPQARALTGNHFRKLRPRLARPTPSITDTAYRNNANRDAPRRGVTAKSSASAAPDPVLGPRRRHLSTLCAEFSILDNCHAVSLQPDPSFSKEPDGLGIGDALLLEDAGRQRIRRIIRQHRYLPL